MAHGLCPLSSRIRHGPNDQWSPLRECAVASCDVETRLPWPCKTSDLWANFGYDRLPGAVAASNWRRRKILSCGKKKAENGGVCLQTDTFWTSPLVPQPIG